MVVGLVGMCMPWLSRAGNVLGALSGWSVRSMVVFGLIGLIGLAMLWVGLAARGCLPGALVRVWVCFAHAQMLFLGVLIEGFLVGRPYPLFRRLFRGAAGSGDLLYGALAFVLRSVGSIVVGAVLFLLLSSAVGCRLACVLGRRGSPAGRPSSPVPRSSWRVPSPFCTGMSGPWFAGRSCRGTRSPSGTSDVLSRIHVRGRLRPCR
ncbi:hypothetical protein AB0A94_35240 [Streptomyces sp. NPDC044984]|uniref:hypothetical protein n=1 Tax=Streptomyces sp. NPDC044984 TaxID=3154335 RepID=UPI0033D0874D